MSCLACEQKPVTTYIRVGAANVEISGCEGHLRELIRIFRAGLKAEASKNE